MGPRRVAWGFCSANCARNRLSPPFLLLHPNQTQGQLRGSSSSSVHVERPSPWPEMTASVDSTLGRPYGLGMWTLGLRLIPAVVCVASPVAIIHWDHRDCSSTSFIAADPPCAMNHAVAAMIRGMDVPYGFAWVASWGRNYSGAGIGCGAGAARLTPVDSLMKGDD